MGTHYGTIVADKLLTAITEVAQRLLMENTVALAVHTSVLSSNVETVGISSIRSTTFYSLKSLTERNVVDVSSTKNFSNFRLGSFRFCKLFGLIGGSVKLFLFLTL